ncbi:MAG: carboxypeptidase regulatory-like domain-containing protein, partial [Verrucomicrobiae bacterium]|nr:carboxypeptidase regulatory-like domain-containing protein [Verrucomicrobiae bacterium]
MKPIRCVLLVTLASMPFGGHAAPWVEVLPRDARPGEAITLRGGVVPESGAVRVFWDQAGVTRPLTDETVAADGSFRFDVTVPAAALPGPMSVGVVGLGGPMNGFAWAEMNVLPAPTARLTGALRDPVGGVEVRLLTREGNVVARAVTDPEGGFIFGDLPPGDFTVEPMEGDYPPTRATVGLGESQNVTLMPVDLSKMPPVMLTGLGAIALPGGVYKGLSPVQVGYWGDVPFARLVSLPGKGLPALNLRVWAAVQKTLNGPDGEIEVVFRIRKGTKRIRTLPATQGTVFGQSPFNFQAWGADFNSFDLPQGPLTLEVTVQPVVGRGIVPVLGAWQFPLEVTDFGPRWYAGTVNGAKLAVTRQDFYRLRYEFTGAVPAGPGIGNPLFDEPLDLKFKKVDNRFDLGIGLTERFDTDGAWWGKATGKADLTLFGFPIFDETLGFAGPFGPSLVQSGYSLNPPLQRALPADVHLPVWGAGLPTPIDICGFSFKGDVGIFLDLAGSISLNSSIHSDLRMDATVTPGIDLSLPTGASIEAGPCEATAQVSPSLFVGAPIVLDPWASTAVSWDVCLKLSGTANVSLSCCGIGFGKSVDLFDPILAGNCPAVALNGLNEAGPRAFAPPLNASVAFSPTGQAAAVWENHAWAGGEWLRGAPLISIRRDGVWDEPRPVANEDYAGWEPQVAWLDDRRIAIAWVCRHNAGPDTLFRRSTGLAQVGQAGICDTV